MILPSPRTRTISRLCASASIVTLLACGTSAHADDSAKQHAATTRTPIKHVITIIGENRSFDHVFGLYKPRRGETVANLLSQGILNEAGSPGPRFAKGKQFIAAPQASYFVGVNAANKTPYTVLPPPDLAGTPNAQSTTRPPFPSVAFVAAI